MCFWFIPRSAIPVSCGSSLSFLKNYQSYSQSGCIHSHSSQQSSTSLPVLRWLFYYSYSGGCEVFICSLQKSDVVEHLFSGEVSSRVSCPFRNWVIYLFIVVLSELGVLDSRLSWLANIFSHCVSCLFIFLILSPKQECLKFWWKPVYLFFFCCLCFKCHSWEMIA